MSKRRRGKTRSSRKSSRKRRSRSSPRHRRRGTRFRSSCDLDGYKQYGGTCYMAAAINSFMRTVSIDDIKNEDIWRFIMQFQKNAQKVLEGFYCPLVPQSVKGNYLALMKQYDPAYIYNTYIEESYDKLEPHEKNELILANKVPPALIQTIQPAEINSLVTNMNLSEDEKRSKGIEAFKQTQSIESVLAKVDRINLTDGGLEYLFIIAMFQASDLKIHWNVTESKMESLSTLETTLNAQAPNVSNQSESYIVFCYMLDLHTSLSRDTILVLNKISNIYRSNYFDLTSLVCGLVSEHAGHHAISLFPCYKFGTPSWVVCNSWSKFCFPFTERHTKDFNSISRMTFVFKRISEGQGPREVESHHWPVTKGALGVEV